MAVWKRTVKIKDCLGEGKPVEEVGRAIAGRLRRLLNDRILDERENDELENIIDELEVPEDVEHLDRVLSALYDWADYNRVWLGP